MDSFRVSLFSPVAADYEAYHRPKDYTFADVCASLELIRQYHRQVAINLLAYPGFTDDEDQVAALIDLLKRYQITQVQLRNLNCDPRLMSGFIVGKKPLGIRHMLGLIMEELPDLVIGNYSRDLRDKAK